MTKYSCVQCARLTGLGAARIASAALENARLFAAALPSANARRSRSVCQSSIGFDSDIVKVRPHLPVGLMDSRSLLQSEQQASVSIASAHRATFLLCWCLQSSCGYSYQQTTKVPTADSVTEVCRLRTTIASPTLGNEGLAHQIISIKEEEESRRAQEEAIVYSQGHQRAASWSWTCIMGASAHVLFVSDCAFHTFLAPACGTTGAGAT
jgi:hypothetical protein